MSTPTACQGTYFFPWDNPNNAGDTRHVTLQQSASQASPGLVENPADADHSCLMVLSSGEPSSCCDTLLEDAQCRQTNHFDSVVIVCRLQPITATINTVAALLRRLGRLVSLGRCWQAVCTLRDR
ncbi:hypothetical protein MN608_02384 [Microdochium nivale]|nr:hypothetical protein MN608_02384 [Microdochium nivale]